MYRVNDLLIDLRAILIWIKKINQFTVKVYKLSEINLLFKKKKNMGNQLYNV